MVDGRELLVVSVWQPDALHHVAYRLDGTWHRLTWGPAHYAASAFTDSAGRPGLVTWLRGVGGEGWAGATSLPMTLRVVGDRLVARPHETLAQRRTPAPPGTLPLAADLEWAPSPGDSLTAHGVPRTTGGALAWSGAQPLVHALTV